MMVPFFVCSGVSTVCAKSGEMKTGEMKKTAPHARE
jgi:hypothetical protein